MCPYCNGEMERGVIYSDRYALKWITEKDDQGAIFWPFTKGIKLTNWKKGHVAAKYCHACSKIVIDLKVDESNS